MQRRGCHLGRVLRVAVLAVSMAMLLGVAAASAGAPNSLGTFAAGGIAPRVAGANPASPIASAPAGTTAALDLPMPRSAVVSIAAPGAGGSHAESDRAASGPARSSQSGTERVFGWPLRPRPAVVRRFDKPEHNWLPGHRGVDLAALAGQSVHAAGAGVVVFVGEVAGKPVVSIDHPGGLRTTYEPVRGTLTPGRRVGRGDVIGTVEAGHPECAAPACLHWGVRRGREYLDPLALVRATPIRLEPLDSPPTGRPNL